MSPAVSVVVSVPEDLDDLRDLVASLDAQTLPTDAFEVVVLDAGGAGTTASRMREVSRHRPHYRLADLGPDGTEWFDACSGDHVLRLGPGQTLLPEALVRLRDLAEQYELTAVVGRVARVGVALPPEQTEDRTTLPESAVAAATTGAVVLVRRSDGTASGVAAGISADRIGVLASYPAAVERRPTAPDPVWRVRQDQPAAEWVEGVLHVTTTGTLTGPSEEAAEDATGTPALGLVRHVESGMSLLLPPATSVLERDLGAEDLPVGEQRWRWMVELAVDVDELGLADGVWEVDVQPPGPTPTSPPPVVVAWTACPPALTRGAAVATTRMVKPTLQLDVGPTTWPLVTGVSPADGVVRESARGSLLELTLPSLHTVGNPELVGQVGLDGLHLTARIITAADGPARLETFVSGWVGRPKLTTAFGSAPFKPTGLALDVSGMGVFRVVKEPRAAKMKEKAPAKAAAPQQRAKPKKPVAASSGPATRKPTPPSSPVQALRRRVPAAVEPWARRLAKVPAARRAYRWATGLR